MKYVNSIRSVIKQENLTEETWVVSNTEDQALLDKITSAGKNLGDFVNGGAKRGVLTGLTEALVIDAEKAKSYINLNPKSENHIYPFLLGREAKPYLSANPAKYLIKFEKGFTKKNGRVNPEDWFKNEHPEIFEHLNGFKEKAEKRTDKGDYYWELRACDYYDKFDQPKIKYQVFQVKPCFIYDEEGMYCNNSMWILLSNNKVLLGILNSKIGWWLISKYFTQIQNGYQLIWKYFSQIPIASAGESQSEIITKKVDKILSLKKEDPEADASILEAEIDQLVYKLYDSTEEEIKIVEQSGSQ